LGSNRLPFSSIVNVSLGFIVWVLPRGFVAIDFIDPEG
jgi:hypothetical protein